MQGIEAMVYPLPEDILVRKCAGDLKGALALIDIYLREERAPLLRERLELEKQRIARLPGDYPLSRDAALGMAQSAISGLTDEEFDALELSGDIQYIYIEGQKRYFKRFLPSLFKLRPDVAARAGRQELPARPLLDDAIAELKRKGELAYKLRMRASLRISDAAFKPSCYRVHMPLPARSAQQSELRLIDHSAGLRDVRGEDAPARTAFFERDMSANEEFFVEYEYVNRVRLFDASQPARVLYPDEPAPCEDDLAEQPGHIVFSPYLRALADSICQGKPDALGRARAIYDYVTTHVRYSFMREYFLLPPIAEYVALGLKGDCGVQALLFITLCRIAGIPARWQSGLSATLTDAGCHDWAQFYVEGWGWLFADCSFGGGARRADSMERWDFYFGNLDPFRMVANSRFQQQLEPRKEFARIDPYDNQTGECESAERALMGDELDTECRVISAQKL